MKTMTIAQYVASLNRAPHKGAPEKLWSKLFEHVQTIVTARFYNPTEDAPEFDQTIASQIEKKLGLEFLPDNPQSGRVCFAQNPEVRDAFKTYFTPLNLADYIYATLQASASREKHQDLSKDDFLTVPSPHNTDQFWKFVKEGKDVREGYFSV